MKKVLLGCGIFAVVAIVALGVGVFYLYRSAGDYLRGFQQLGEAVELNQRIENQTPYEPPPNRRLEATQVERFLEVQRNVHYRLGARYEELEEKYRDLDPGAGGRLSIFQLVEAWRDLSNLLVGAKEAQVEALNDEGFSLSEYQWVRARVYEAVGISLSGMDLEKIAEAVQRGEILGTEIRVEESIPPEQNVELVKPYAEELLKFAALSWLGL